jgi:hypothetical protein
MSDSPHRHAERRMSLESQMFHEMDFPFPGDRFPAKLGATIQRTVLDGDAPALYVGHTDENTWLVGDGKTDPNAPGAVVVAHIRHVVDLDPTLEAMATLPIGTEADREHVGAPWVITPFEWEAELGDQRP